MQSNSNCRWYHSEMATVILLIAVITGLSVHPSTGTCSSYACCHQSIMLHICFSAAQHVTCITVVVTPAGVKTLISVQVDADVA